MPHPRWEEFFLDGPNSEHRSLLERDWRVVVWIDLLATNPTIQNIDTAELKGPFDTTITSSKVVESAKLFNHWKMQIDG